MYATGEDGSDDFITLKAYLHIVPREGVTIVKESCTHLLPFLTKLLSWHYCFHLSIVEMKYPKRGVSYGAKTLELHDTAAKVQEDI